MLPLGRTRPDTRGRLAFAGLAAMGFVLLAGLFPGGGWIASLSSESSTEAPSVAEIESPDTIPASVVENDTDADTAVDEAGEPLAAQWQRWTGWLAPTSLPPIDTQAESPSVDTRAHWMFWFVAALLIAQVLAVIRLIGGFWALKLLETRGQACEDADMQRRLLHLANQSRMQAPLNLTVVDRIDTPAVVGWRRFTILLPPEYRQWSGDQRDAVLAHELAHVARRDGWWRTMAVLLQAVHFYNPLAHVLSRRVILEQELAADKMACDWLGQRETYLQSLASLALKKRSPTPAWSTLAFLPPRSMFLRRLEMLREVPRVFPQVTERAVQVATLALLITAALVVGGLRPLSAQPPAATAKENSATKLTIDVDDQVRLSELIPNRFGMIFQEIDFSQLMKSRKIVEKLTIAPDAANGISFGEILRQQITVVPPSQVDSVLIAFFEKPVTLIKSKQAFTIANGKTMVIVPHDNGTDEFMLLTPNVLARASRDVLEELSRFLKQPADQRESLARNIPPSKAFMRVSVDWPVYKPYYLNSQGFQNSPPQMMIRPLTDNAKRWTLEASSPGPDKPMTVKLVGEFPTEKDAQTAEETLIALRVLLQNIATGMKDQFEGDDQKVVFELGVALLNEAQPKVSGSEVVVTSTVDRTMDEMINVFAPALFAARLAAQREQDMNNLKQLMIAMHNYHDMYGHLPKAVVIDPESGVPHSWRVELLPLLNHKALYKQYRMDQPWDSPANKKVLEQMPAVFKTASGNDAVTTNFLAIVGKNTALAPSSDQGNDDAMEFGVAPERPSSVGDNPRFHDMTDGTSNTIVFVQTSKDVPWTKPEDLPLEEADSAKLGGFHSGIFLAAFADGSARVISNQVDPEVWTRLITRNDGEIIPQ
ncbi:M56 family metallopeptidase [Blastopirellula marina]|uniref:M56 family metallopeptidase n=1 Tax=Blastopirellula marina TaxID=124 RepID=UPI001304ADD5|nr:M56 family metallopeptidase [Blastopirellula marina]